MSTTHSIIIAGSRTFDNYVLLCNTLSDIVKQHDVIEIVSGTASGADKLGERYAQDNNYLLKKFPADWDAYGNGAGYIRNKEMADYADECVVFWDGNSKGTKHMIDLAKKNNLPTTVINF